MKKKAQMMMEQAPAIIVGVSLTFLILATLAYIGSEYGDALRTDDTTASIANETVTTVNEAYETLAYNKFDNPRCTIVRAINSTDGVEIPSTNYTTNNCQIKYSGKINNGWNNTDWKVQYTVIFDLDTVATNVTTDMNTEIDDNVSIAGIILTVSLIGLVISILMGIFLLVRKPRI